MAVTPTYDATIARVRLTASDTFTADYVTVQRSINGVQWTTVRGAAALTPAAGSVSIDDYEFVPGVVNTYRARSYSAADDLLGSESAGITPVIDQVWLKSIARPFLNQKVTVQEYSEITRPGRAGMFTVPGRTFPVRVADVMGGRSWQYELLTRTETEAKNLEFLIASGDVILAQVPPSYDIPGGYLGASGLTKNRLSRTLADSRRLFSLPVDEIAAPGPGVVGFTVSWETLIAEFGTWADVLAAFPTWADVQQYVSDPQTVIVS